MLKYQICHDWCLSQTIDWDPPQNTKQEKEKKDKKNSDISRCLSLDHKMITEIVVKETSL